MRTKRRPLEQQRSQFLQLKRDRRSVDDQYRRVAAPGLHASLPLSSRRMRLAAAKKWRANKPISAIQEKLCNVDGDILLVDHACEYLASYIRDFNKVGSVGFLNVALSEKVLNEPIGKTCILPRSTTCATDPAPFVPMRSA